MTAEELLKIMPYAKLKVDVFLAPLNKAMDEFQINTPMRKAAFLGQIGHESAQLRYVRELASGAAYEGRKDLGNICVGDGRRCVGRGLIQITGRANYVACGKALGCDLLTYPELLETPTNACGSAGWFWATHKLNELADVGDFLTITKKINGGTNGLADRASLYDKAKEVLL